jgi:Kef-type K+ transport system membrane component KefB
MLVSLALFVGAARFFGDVAMRLRQPQVLGELIAGVLLGPSLLGLFSSPALHALQRGAKDLDPLGWLGIILLLALTGIDTDFTTLRRQARVALFATLGGVVTPLAAGFMLGFTLPRSLVGPHGPRLVFALFLALAMSISAVTVITKVLVDIGQMRRTAAKIIVAGGVFDETLGWVLLALVSGLANAALAPGGGAIEVGAALVVMGKAVAFLVGALLFGRRLVNAIVRIVRDRARVDEATFTVTILLAIGFAATTEALGLHQILGAFVFGMIAGTVPRIDRETVERLRVVTRAFLVPLFFVFAGLRVDLTKLTNPQILRVAIAFIGIAIAAKIVGCTLGGLAARMRAREALLVGIGMSARGSMEIIVAVLGLSLGILSPAIFSVIVLLSVVTIVIVPPMLRLAFAATPPDAEERARLEREDLDRLAYTPKLRRILVPMLPNAAAQLGAEAARALARSKVHAAEPLEIVVLRLEGNGKAARAGGDEAEERLVREASETPTAEPIDVEQQVATKGRPLDAMTEALKRGYQMLVVGVPAPTTGSALFGPIVDGLIRDAPCDLFIVSSRFGLQIDRVKRILVPLTGKESARAAGDLALALASGLGASVLAVTIVREDLLDHRGAAEQIERRRRSAVEAMNEMRERAERLGVAFKSTLRDAAIPGQAIVEALGEPEVDLCILGVSDESRRGAPFFGDTAELLLRAAPTPVGLLVMK